MADRNALLSQIQGGKKLKKTVTNDRSGPIVGGGGSGGGGGGPPPGAMGLPRAPMVPPGAGGAGRAPAPAPAPMAAPVAMPGLGGLFSAERPKLKHRAGGVNIGRNSEDNDTPASSRAPPPPSAPAPAAEKSPDAPRFSLSFLRKNHNRSSSHGAPESAPPAPPAPPTTQAPLRPPVVPGRRADSGAPPLPPTSAPSRPGSSISTKRAPPVPPASKKPTIKPKPAGLSSSRLSSINSSPNPAMNSSPNLRSQLRPTSVSPRNSAEGQDPYGGIISESQGSVSSLRGMFGKSVRNRPAVQSHAPVESSFAEPPRAPAKAPPPLPPSIADNSAYSHRRTSSNSPGQPLPPPPAPAALPSRPAAANGSSGVPVREGKWTFHTMSELPPPPPSSTIPQHVYPSRNYTGSTINIDI